MFQNIGTVDRVIRIVAGVALGAFGLAYHSWWGLLAFLPLVTAGVGVCPAYLPFGISTKKAAAAAGRK